MYSQLSLITSIMTICDVNNYVENDNKECRQCMEKGKQLLDLYLEFSISELLIFQLFSYNYSTNVNNGFYC